MLTLSWIVVMVTLNAQDEQDVKQVVTSAYIEGIHNGGPVENIRKGFHPAFNMLRLIDNQVKPLPIEEWIRPLYACSSAKGLTRPWNAKRFHFLLL